MRCKVDAARRVRIPSELCRTLDIRPGDEMTVSLRGGRIEMKKLENRCLFCGSDENLTAYGETVLCPLCYEKLKRGQKNK